MSVGAGIKLYIVVLLVAVLSLAGCSQGGQPARPAATPTPPPTPTMPDVPVGAVETSMAHVTSLMLVLTPTFPVQVNAVVKGNLADACTSISDVSQQRDGDIFKLAIVASRPVNKVCANVITPYEKTIPLEVEGLKAGTYTVDANGVSKKFRLTRDNSPP